MSSTGIQLLATLIGIAGALGAFTGFVITRAMRLAVLIDRLNLRMAENSMKIRQIEGYLNKEGEYFPRAAVSEFMEQEVNEYGKNKLY